MMLISLLRERERRSTWKDGEKRYPSNHQNQWAAYEDDDLGINHKRLVLIGQMRREKGYGQTAVHHNVYTGRSCG